MGMRGSRYQVTDEDKELRKQYIIKQNREQAKKGIELADNRQDAQRQSFITNGASAKSSKSGSTGAKGSNNAGAMQGIAAGSDVVTQTGVLGDENSDASQGQQGAHQGFMAGMQSGNIYAALAGAVIGGTSGVLGAKSKRKAKAAQIEAEKQNALAKVEEIRTQRVQEALNGMRTSFSNALRGGGSVNLGGR